METADALAEIGSSREMLPKDLELSSTALTPKESENKGSSGFDGSGASGSLELHPSETRLLEAYGTQKMSGAVKARRATICNILTSALANVAGSARFDYKLNKDIVLENVIGIGGFGRVYLG